MIILAGAVARHFGIIRREDGPVLVRFVIYLALPALIFLILIDADLDAALLLVPVAAFAIHFLLLGISWAGHPGLGDGAAPGRRADRRDGGRQHGLLRAPADRGVRRAASRCRRP